MVGKDDRPKASLRGAGFTVIEIMISIAVLSIILAVAIPNFTRQIQSGRAEMAAKSFARAVANARDVASRTGRRTVLAVNPPASSVTECNAPVWAITQETSTTPIVCMTANDFVSRYEGATMSPDAAVTITYLPTGIATNTTAQTYLFVAGNVTKKVTINAGGTADIVL